MEIVGSIALIFFISCGLYVLRLCKEENYLNEFPVAIIMQLIQVVLFLVFLASFQVFDTWVTRIIVSVIIPFLFIILGWILK